MARPHEHRLRVRYSETDQMGVVYHANYLVYMDEARTSLLEELGFPYHELERDGVGLVVRKADLRYRQAACFGDWLLVETRVQSLRGASVQFAYDIRRAQDGLLLASGSTELACLDLTRSERPPRVLPEEVRRALEPLAAPAADALQAPRGPSGSSSRG
jgi:acyl-CoA thioester hydrolase